MSYNIYEYGEKVVKRTLNFYPDMNHNNHHMIMGLTSELTEELIVALDQNDMVNVVEELGDATFFNVGSMIQNGFYDDFKEQIENSDKLLLDLGFDWTDEEYSKKLTPTEKKDMFNNVLFVTFKAVGTLNTIYKNTLVKSKPVYNKVELTREQICSVHIQLQVCINTITTMIGKNYHDVRQVNDIKLDKRHKGGPFTVENSNNRDTDAERKVMEDTLDNK